MNFDKLSNILNENNLLELSKKFIKEDSVEIFIQIIFKNIKENKNPKKQIEELFSLSWKKLHTGYWKDVKETWRELFAYSVLLLVYSKIKMMEKNLKNLKELMKKIDLGLIMGNGLFESELQMIIQNLHSETIKHFGIEQVMLKEKIKKRKIEKLKFEIKRIQNPSLTEFKRYLNDKEPVIITNAMNEWPGMKKWNDLNYFKNTCGYRTVPVETGTSYTSDDWSQKLMTISEFIDFYLIEEKKGYLAQHQIFEQIMELKKDILEPVYCISGKGILNSVNCWFGPKETISPLHHDPYDNIYCQVVGSKYIRLYDSNQTDKLYPKIGIFSNTSEISDVFNVDESKYSLFHKGIYSECVIGII
eukprot:gene4235-7572_t